jgi:hypothetical protein
MIRKSGKKKQKPPPRWRRHLVQAELELPPPAAGSIAPGSADASLVHAPYPEWWQHPAVAGSLAALSAVLLLVTAFSIYGGHRDRALAAAAETRARTLTLRATTAERPLRVAPNPRSWSAEPDATIAWPEPPEMLDVFLPVAYSEFTSFWLAIDKVDQGRVLVVQRIAPDSNKELRLSLNSSSFGPGEYRIRLQGYTWRGDRVDAGWVRLVVTAGNR